MNKLKVLMIVVFIIGIFQFPNMIKSVHNTKSIKHLEKNGYHDVKFIRVSGLETILTYEVTNEAGVKDTLDVTPTSNGTYGIRYD